MRLLIDGYNLMYAGGLLGQRLGPNGLRRVRTRFLNDLAAALGPVESHFTTIVFDAKNAPEDRPGKTRHKGVEVIFSVDDDDADARIEHLIAQHSSPKTLTVVSSDNRVRLAATRRKARVQTSDQFWVELDCRKAAKTRKPVPIPMPDRAIQGRTSGSRWYWQNEFRDVAEMPETREAPQPRNRAS